jgi:hypothetical protein
VIRAGDSVQVRTYDDQWLPARATSGVEGTHRDGRKVHDFPVVYVTTDGSDGTAVPWPAEDVRR